MNYRDERVFRVGGLAETPGFADLQQELKEYLDRKVEGLLTQSAESEILRQQREIKGAKDLLTQMQLIVDRYASEYQKLLGGEAAQK